jgi:pimeloyl-ACP methyl ester carboxylesterase
MLLQGDADWLVFQEKVEETASRILGSKIAVLAGTGYYPMTENPLEFYDTQLVAGFDRARRRAVGRHLGMGGNDGGKARDAMMCAVVRKFRYGRVERDRGAQRQR